MQRFFILLLTLLCAFTGSKAQSGAEIFWAADNIAPWANTATDADAIAYINREHTAGYNMSTSEQTAVNTFVTGLKTNSLYTKIFEMWLFIGGTSGTEAIGFKAVTNGVFPNSATFTSGGVQFNGTNQYMNTGVVPSTNLTLNNTHLAYYSRTAAAGAAGYYDMGAYISGTQELSLIGYRTGGGQYSIQYNETGAQGMLNSTGATDGSGMFIGSRPSSTSHFLMRNGTSLLSQTTSGGSLPTTVGICLGANNNGGVVQSFSTRQYCFCSVGQGFTSTEAQTYSTLVNNLQTALGRNVY